MQNDSLIYTHLSSPLGEMIAGTLADGVCLLEWHDRGGVNRVLERAAKRYKRPTIEGSHPLLTQLVRELKEYFEGARTVFTVPIGVDGTPFERRTWELLLTIPYGQTRSYGEMAKMMANPGAARAVGRANGANYLSIVIPCHRVIESGGGLRGYGGGVWRKEYLLDLESGAGRLKL